MASKPEPVFMTTERKRSMMARVGGLQAGQWYRVLIERCRPRRSNSQLRYYFGAYVNRLIEHIIEKGGESQLPAGKAERKELVHGMLKIAGGLEPPVIRIPDKHGEIREHPGERTTKDLDTLGMTEFLDRLTVYFLEMYDIIVLSPEEWQQTGGGDDEYEPLPQF